jgi:hypothetical protein
MSAMKFSRYVAFKIQKSSPFDAFISPFDAIYKNGIADKQNLLGQMKQLPKHVFLGGVFL